MLVVPALLALIVVMVIGVPVPLAFLISSVVIAFGTGVDPQMLLINGYNKINSVLLLTIPLFVLAGSLMNNGGLGEKLVDSVSRSRLGKSKSSLGVVTVVACAVFGAVSGSSSATVSCIGSIMAPRLRENGYSDGLIGALVASSGVLGILIPPSMIMILFAWAANVSVLGCFVATVLPGILLVILLSITQTFLFKRSGVSVADTIIEQAKQQEALKAQAAAEKAAKADMKGKKKKSGESAIPALMMPVIILGSIYGGFLTATEAAALSVVYAIPIGIFYYKKINWESYRVAMIDAGKTAGVIMCMMLSVQILSRLYITENLPDLILGVLTSISSNKIVILLMINVFMVIMGMLMDDCSNTTLLTPILWPIMNSLGISVFHFAAILGVNIGMGNITPPTAPLLYLSGRITGAEVKNMLKPTLILILCAWLPTLIITTYWTGFSEFLPRILGYM
ncbi:TRAP transporter large permease subunit [uncultured Intestinimonas sp.]|uniref:TRAP transporter large permease n=1 Tax=uncultured Intestinimonas sp. TaxID=1689265 RepID=UPI0025EC1A5C|nr:TRAP transporter large permease subunit [uncultured Intestinimonas sp.]